MTSSRGSKTSSTDSASSEFPIELIDTVHNFQRSLNELEDTLRPFLVVPRIDLQESAKLTSLEKAKLDCLSSFALNSLVWIWLRTKGRNPKDTEVKVELARVKKSMVKLKEIQDKHKRQKVDQEAAKRIVSSGLWCPGVPKKRHAVVNSSNSQEPNRKLQSMEKRTKWSSE